VKDVRDSVHSRPKQVHNILPNLADLGYGQRHP
jgi:hypothetical protein